MSFPRYPKYKDSGVEWLGEVPDGWEPVRLRFVSMTNPSKSELSAMPLDTLVSFLPMEAIGEDGTLRLDTEREIRELVGGYSYFRDGDVAVAKITPCFENGKGALMHGLRGGIGFGTTELIVIRPDARRIAPRFLTYVTRSRYFLGLGEGHMYGAGGQKRVPEDFVRNFSVFLPALPEQHAIAAFLDRETARIDALVAEQERLIELLREKRQAVISHAVTKGLNPNVPMKDSGVEWLPTIPQHWRTVQVKHLARPGAKTFTDGDWIEAPYITESGVRLIQTGNVGIGTYKEQGFRYVSENTFSALGCTEVLPGDVLICRLDGPVGRACLAPNLGGRMITSVDNAVLKVAGHVVPGFVVALFSSTPWLSWIDVLCRVGGGFRLRVSRSQLGELRLPLPPRDEQAAIVQHLHAASAHFDALAAEAQGAIDLLQERRAALITAAVTGQIDARNVRPEEHHAGT